MTEEIITTPEGSAASTDVRTGFLSGPGFVDEPVRYSVVNGIALFQGCIEMGPVAEVEARAADVRARLASSAQAPQADGRPPVPIEMKGIGVGGDSQYLWPNGVVPFVIDAGLPDQGRVTQAINHIHENTGIRFVARTTHANYIRFVRNPGVNFSSSPVGMQGGEQLIRLSDGSNMGVIVHECCHSLGILHEQSRSDRDQFVQIKYANITAGFEGNFDKFGAAQGFYDYFDYDYGSLMHYGATSFSKNGQPTIVPLKAGVTIGQRNGLSTTDRLTIAHMYAKFTGTGHTGVWRAGTGGYALWVNANWQSFQEKWQQWSGQGLRLVDIDVRRVGNEDRFSGVWLPGTGGYALWVNASWDSLVAKWQEWANQGLRLVDLSVRRVGNQDRYSGVWKAGTGGYALWGNASWDSFVAKWNEWAAQGLRLVDINVQRVGANTRYTGVWLAGTGGYGLWANASKESFIAKWKEWANQGLRLADISIHQDGNAKRYSGVFLPGTDAYYLWVDVPWESFRARWQQLAADGFRLVDYEFTVPAAADAADFDIAGTPVAAALADEAPGAFGGIFGDGGELLDAGIASGIPAAAAARAGNGNGGHQNGAGVPAAAAAAATADGSGGAVLEPAAETASASASTQADGMGEAVLVAADTKSAAQAADGEGGAGGLDVDLTRVESEKPEKKPVATGAGGKR